MKQRVLKELITEYLAFLQDEKGMARASLRSYRRAVENFLKTASASPEGLFLPPGWELAEVDKRSLEAYLNHLGAQRGWRPASLAQQASALRSFFSFLQRRGHLERNPARSLTFRANQPGEAPPRGEEAAVLGLFDVPGDTLAGARLLLLLELLYGAAQRTSVVYGLRTLKPNRRAGTVTLSTGEHSAEAALSPAGMERARHYLAHRKALVGRRRKAAFWVGERGEGLSPAALAKEVKQEMERAGLPPRPSLLRQLSARHFAERGADTRSLRQLLQAKRLGSLDRYAPPDAGQVLRQFRALHPRQRDGS